MSTKQKRWSFPFLNGGIGATLLKGNIYKFIRVNGSTFLGKLVGKPSAKEITIQNEEGTETIEIYRTDEVRNITPSRKVGARKKK